ncbi:phosphotransferase [Streptomyces sp. NPDC021608]|uniref:phosphotransferase n=1 Tax=Streptomyces sp. NPDC021608 TaxID=3154903 RepID=UPI0033F4CF57
MPHAPPLGALLHRYAAGSALACEPVAEGLLNRGYRLRTTRGRYFLKHHVDPDTADPASIARRHRVTERLADLGVPIALPLPGRDGRTVAVVGGHAYALHPWVEGRHRHGSQLTPGQCGRLGALLGVVHTGLEHVMRTPARQPSPGRGERVPPAREPEHTTSAGRSFHAEHAPRPGPVTPAEAAPPASGPAARADPSSSAGRVAPGSEAVSEAVLDVLDVLDVPGGPEAAGAPASLVGAAVRPDPAARSGTGPPGSSPAPGRPDALAASPDPADTFVLIDDLLARVRRHRPADSFDELARHRLLERRRLLEQHADRRPPHGGPVGWVHGDFHPFNLLYRGDAPAAIVDWDRLGVQPRAEEAVRAAVIFFVRPDGTLELPKARQYARAYRRAAGASPAELAAAVHRVWWERLNDFWMLRWRYERGDTRADSQFPASSALAVWWTREYDAVREAFTD